MPGSRRLKGLAFEWFVRNLLNSCGFNSVAPDDNIIYEDSKGTMIHGLGQPHNADVLMSPPFQIPFYFPSRILIECKCLDQQVGLPTIRGVHGLREDINGFDVVTPDILKKRRNYRRKGTASYEFDRFNYQVAVASITGFKKTAQEYAMVHRIPLISFYKATLFSRLRDYLNAMDANERELDEEDKKLFADFFMSDNQEILYSNITEKYNAFFGFAKEAAGLFRKVCVGILENGMLLFLFMNNRDYNLQDFKTTCTIHWRSYDSYWSIKPQNRDDSWELFFELPKELYHLWTAQNFNKGVAVDIKAGFFKKIYVFGNKNGTPNFDFHILELSQSFIDRARKEAEHEE